jgi:hypothetical protein
VLEMLQTCAVTRDAYPLALRTELLRARNDACASGMWTPAALDRLDILFRTHVARWERAEAARADAAAEATQM